MDDDQPIPEVDVDLTKNDITPEILVEDELLEVEVVDVIELLADEPSEDELKDESEEEYEIAQLMDPYGINDY